MVPNTAIFFAKSVSLSVVPVPVRGPGTLHRAPPWMAGDVGWHLTEHPLNRRAGDCSTLTIAFLS